MSKVASLKKALDKKEEIKCNNHLISVNLRIAADQIERHDEDDVDDLWDALMELSEKYEAMS